MSNTNKGQLEIAGVTLLCYVNIIPSYSLLATALINIPLVYSNFGFFKLIAPELFKNQYMVKIHSHILLLE